MKITLKWLKEQGACEDGIEWFKSQKKSDLKEVVFDLLKQGYVTWANWAVVRFITHPQKVQFAIFAAEQVLDIFEKKYPEDKRPRKAIEAARKWLDDPSESNRNAANYAANYAANAAANAAYYAAYYAANTANAAYYAANTADAADYAANAAYYAANAADYAAAYYAANTKEKLQRAIIEYGLKLLGEI